MNVMIFYASYGGGHLSAAKSVKEYIDNNYKNVETELVDCMKYVNKPIEKITTTAYKEMAKKAPWAWGYIYSNSQKGPIAHISSKINTIMAIKLLKLLRQKKPDLIISTHPFSTQMCSYLKRKGKIFCTIATIMTDYQSHDQWLIGHEFTDYYFVAHDYMKYELRKKGVEEQKIYSTGIPISNKFLQTFDKNSILHSLNFKPDKLTVLFFAGGEFGLGKSKTLAVFECLIKNFNNIQIIAISGKNDKMNLAFHKIVIENNKQDTVRIFKFTDKVAEFMSISDFVITKPGGLTTSESLASNLPIIIINPIPGQEEENAEFLESKNVALWIKSENEIFTTLSNLIYNNNKLTEMKNNAIAFGKKNSTKTICDTLLKTLTCN